MIPTLQRFFELNAAPVYFTYGLVFFVLGLAIAFQSRQHSRLELARSLGWLAAFGITHGFYEWGVIFIPIQAAYLSEPLVIFLNVLHTILLGLSFAFLFQFGVEMLSPRWPRLILVPLAVSLVWLLVFFMPGLVLTADLAASHRLALIWARYLIGFPAGITAAYGLRFQAEKSIKPLDMQLIYNTLRIAGIAMATYAIFGGLVVPPGNFFPADWLNEANILQWLGIPLPVFRSITGLALALSMIRALEVFDLEVNQIIEQMELERNLTQERERIGRELHDGAIQAIYTAGLLLESARNKIPAEDKTTQLIDRSMAVLNETIAGLRSYVDGLRPAPVDQPLVEAIRSRATDSHLAPLVRVDLDLDLPSEAALNPLRTQHVLAILSEALSNAARHAHAHQVKVKLRQLDGKLSLVVQDDGKGFKESQRAKSYGLRNMRDRARLLGGLLTVDSTPGNGTCVSLIVPWKEEE